MLKARTAGEKGEPRIVFLHAVGTSGWMWENFFPRLTGFRCIALDLPGHGTSRSVSWRSMEDAADQVAEFIRADGAGKAHVVALSLGSYVGLTLLARHGTLVENCILSGLNVLPLPNKWLMTAMGLALAPLLKTPLAAQMNARALGIPPHQMDGYRNSLRQVSLRGFMAASRDAGNFEIPANTGEIQTPTLLIAGEREHPLIHRSMDKLADALASASKRIVPRGGHGWPGEFPDLFVETVKAWCLAGVLPASLQEPRRLATGPRP